MRVLVTGGAGFIGSVLVRSLIAESGHDLVVLDKLTYAGSLAPLAEVQDSRIRAELGWRPRETFERGIAATVRWFVDHPDWCDRYDLMRLGLGQPPARP